MWTIILGLIVAAVLVWLAVSRTVPRTAAVKQQEPASSYEQKTNHLPTPRYDMGPVPGVESPFRVNMYQAYIE
jgi:lipopolysaccharide export system protein LptC